MKISWKIFCRSLISELLQSLLTNVTGDVIIPSIDNERNKTILECKIIDVKYSIFCSIAVEVDYNYGDPPIQPFGGCYKTTKEDLSIVLSLLSVLKSFECISQNPFTIDYDFGREKPLFQFTKFKRERVSNFFNSTSYSFKIKMIVPNRQRHESDNEVFSRFTYKIGIPNQPMETPKTEVHFFNILRNPKDADFAKIDVTDDMVYLPCFQHADYFKNYLIFIEGALNSETCPYSESKFIQLNSSLAQWNYLEGFKLNVSSLWNRNGTLVCVEEGESREEASRNREKAHLHLCKLFGLQFPPKSQIYPKTDFIRYKSKLATDKPKTSLLIPSIRLFCSSTGNNVTMIFRDLWGHPLEHNGTLSHYEILKPEHRFVAEMDLLYPERKFTGGQKYTGVDCVESSNTENKLHSWSFCDMSADNTDGTQLVYAHSLSKFVCNGTIDEDVHLQQVECDDIYQCRMWENYLRNKKTRELCDYEQISFLKGTECNDHSAYDPKIQNAFCRSLSPVKRAVLQCFMDYQESLNELYFTGFDGIIYTRSDVKSEAILDLKWLNEESYVIIDQNVTFSCTGHPFFHSHGIQWLVAFTNGSLKEIPADMISYRKAEIVNDDYSLPFSVVNIWFRYKDIESIICVIPLLDSKEWQNATKQIQFLDAMAPKIISLESERALSLGDKGQSLSCFSEGRPTPKVEWSRNNRIIEAPLAVSGGKNSKQLIFPEYSDKFQGDYLCTASNAYGITTKYFKLSTKKTDPTLLIVTILACLLIATLPIMFYLIRRLRASQRLILHLSEAEIDDFFQGTVTSESTQSVDDPLAFPYDKKYELDKDSFEIDENEILGSGQFGIVYKGSIISYGGEFAFKTIKHVFAPVILKGLMSELKMMIYVGPHDNIIKLVGAYTKEIKTGLLFIATELCSLGSLHSHLRNIKQDISEDYNFHQSELYSKCLRWSKEIAIGMDYLSSKKVVHSDLAARNILLAEGEVVKISDFGLSRRMYEYSEYKKKDTTNPLPWKWMAIESLRDMTFSTQSDIWAYGVTIWEIFSLGNVPYPGISWTIEFMDMLDQGLRNLEPKYATVDLYKLMHSCWNKNPTERPTFSVLRDFFTNYNVADEDNYTPYCYYNEN